MIWFLKLVRALFITLDNVIFELVDLLYQLFMMLAETGIFSAADIRDFSERIYFFLGLIMIFKVSVSLLQYIMNPDAATDGKVGAPKLLKNIVFVLVGIVLIPYIFNMAFSLQRIILKDNIIGNLIIGSSIQSKGENSNDVIKNAGNTMAFSTFTAFFHFNDEYVSTECANNPYEPYDTGIKESEACIGSGTSEDTISITDVLETFYASTAGSLYKEAYLHNNMHKIAANWDVYTYTFENADGKEEFLFDYMYIVTSVGGVFLAYILLVFCFDVAVRSVKLGFLQLIAPIPLISKIDPKKGDEVFGKWVKECTSTYISLFIRLVSIYFAIYIITIVNRPYNVVTGENENNLFVFVFICFGTLLFVKDLPKLIETITGMKMSGGLSFSKKLRSVPLIGGAADQGLRFAGRTAKNLGKAGLTATGKGLGFVGRGIADKTGLSAKAAEMRNSELMNNARIKMATLRSGIGKVGNAIDGAAGGAFSDIGRDASLTRRGMVGALETATGILDAKERQLASREGAILESQAGIKSRNSQRQAVAEVIKKMEDRAKDRIKEGLGGALSDDYRKHSANLEIAKRSGSAEDIAKAQAKLDSFLDHAAGNYISMVNNGTGGISDGTMLSFFEDYKSTVEAADKSLGISAIDFSTDTRAGETLHSQSSAMKTAIGNEQRTMIKDNQELEQIKEERRQIAETRRAGKDSMGPGFGPGPHGGK